MRVWDIGLLGRIVRMDEDQARALWELLRKHFQMAEIDKQSCGKRLRRFLEKMLKWHSAKINNNNNE